MNSYYKIKTHSTVSSIINKSSRGQIHLHNPPRNYDATGLLSPATVTDVRCLYYITHYES